MSEIQIYSANYCLLMTIIGIIVCFLVYFTPPSKRELLIPVPFYVVVTFCLIIAFIMAFSPVLGDKQRYEKMFIYAGKYMLSRDLAWEIYIKICRLFFRQSIIFFIITSFIYIYGYYIFFKTYIPKEYLFYIFMLETISLGFYAYGVNTIRAGFALSVFLIALSHKNKPFLFIVFCMLSVLLHKSMCIPIFSYLITTKIERTDFFFGIWCLFFVVSALNITIITDFIQSYVDIDERVVSYLSAKKNFYYIKMGFRYDFVIFSLIPMAFGYYYIYIKMYKDRFYIQLFNMYLVANSIWLLVIRIPFSDRMAYLSWFLIPVLLLYPLLKTEIVYAQFKKVSYILALYISINIILNYL